MSVFPGGLCPRRILRVAVLLASTVCAACSVVQVRYPDGRSAYYSRENFRNYVEEVFRYHNRVVDDLIMSSNLGGAPDLTADPQVLHAEQHMARVCLPLNDAVAAHIEGRDLSLFRKLALAEAVPNCEDASRRLEALIPSI